MPEKTEYQQQAKIFTALSDPTRLQIVELLAGCNELATAAIADKLEISLSLACHHAKILAESGLIEKRKEGQTSYSRLIRAPLLKTLENLTRLTDRSPTER